MNMRQGIVVATHPEDHSVDLVMVDDGSRLSGVQVMSANASSRSGSIDMPAVPEKKNKWDITEKTGQEMIAMVGYVGGRHPVVTGFLYPQVNQMLFKDPKMRFNRHQSDVMSYTDGDGNFGIMHPSGAFIQVGEKPEKPELADQNADVSLKPDRNTGKKVFLRVALGGNAVEVTMTPDGTCTVKMKQDFNVEAEGDINLKAEGNILLEAGGTFSAKAAGKSSIDGSTVHFNEG